MAATASTMALFGQAATQSAQPVQFGKMVIAMSSACPVRAAGAVTGVTIN